MRYSNIRLWLPAYLEGVLHRRRLRTFRQQNLVHMIFFVCDHYEPRHGATSAEQPGRRVSQWREGFAALQDYCLQRHGTRPLHSWFYPPHHGYEHLPALADFVLAGLGEVELHLHHRDDTTASLRAKLVETLDQYRRAGLLLQEGSPPGQKFGFIHGDWALDNAGGKYCGVNDELSLLQELGCWGDMTMPSSEECQTRKINSIYYAVDDPLRPKSHDRGTDAEVGKPGQAGLWLLQGPLGINWRAPHYPRIENASLTSYNWGRPDRIRVWERCHVHVKGRPEWLFVKLHTHGAIEKDFDGLFGKRARALHDLLATQYNDGRRYRLHYVTAREAFNIARAAEAGAAGDPSAYRDFEIRPPAARHYHCDAPHRLLACDAEMIEIDSVNVGTNRTARLRFTDNMLQAVAGPVTALRYDRRNGYVEVRTKGDGEAIEVTATSQLQVRGNARIVRRETM